MDPVTTIAVKSAISGSSKAAKEARAALTPGEHEVNVVVKIQGKLKVGDDQEIAATGTLLNLEFLSLVLHHAGITRSHAAKIIEETAGEYLVNWTGSKDDVKAAKAARKAKVEEFDPDGKLDKFFKSFRARLPLIPRAGAVNFVGAVVEVGTHLTVVEDDASESVA